MDVEFDPAKDRVNLRKHGISLARAEDFDMTGATLRVDDRFDYGEVRYRAIGFLDGRLFVLVFTVREETVRAISLRRAEREEETEYAAFYET